MVGVLLLLLVVMLAVLKVLPALVALVVLALGVRVVLVLVYARPKPQASLGQHKRAVPPSAGPGCQRSLRQPGPRRSALLCAAAVGSATCWARPSTLRRLPIAEPRTPMLSEIPAWAFRRRRPAARCTLSHTHADNGKTPAPGVKGARCERAPPSPPRLGLRQGPGCSQPRHNKPQVALVALVALPVQPGHEGSPGRSRELGSFGCFAASGPSELGFDENEFKGSRAGVWSRQARDPQIRFLSEFRAGSINVLQIPSPEGAFAVKSRNDPGSRLRAGNALSLDRPPMEGT